MTAQFIAMERTIEASELLEMVVETEAGAGARGLSVAGGGKEGLFVKDVLKDSPAARVLSLQEGDQLLSARVYFDNIKYEDALQILKCAEPYKVSFCLKRVVPSTDVSRKPGATVFEVRGPKAKMAKLNIQSLSSLKRKKRRRRRRMVSQSLQETEAYLAFGKLEGPPVDVEFSFPKFFKLRKARSAGEVAVTEPGPDSLWSLSSLETKQHRLKFPRLKVKEAAAAEARLAVGLPHLGLELKKAGRGGGSEGKMFRFIIPFSKTKKPKEEAGPKMEVGFQAPQVEFALPLSKMGAEEESLKPGPKGESLAALEFRDGWPNAEAALPKASASAPETPSGLLQAGLKLSAAEVAAPKVDVDLALPRLERAAPEAAPKKEGFRIKVPKFGISAEEAELKLPLMKIPALEVALGESLETVLEEQLRPGGAVHSLGMGTPGVDLELSFPKGKTGVERPEISGRLPLANLPQRGSKAPGGGAGKLPQVDVSVGKPESPKADKTKSSVIQLPGLVISLREQPLESQEVAGAAGGNQVGLPEVRVPTLDISAPKVQDMHLCKAMGEPAAPSGRAKLKEAAEGVGFKFQMPQISLPKFDFSVKTSPCPPRVQVKMPKPEGDLGTKVSLPKVDVSLPAKKVPGVQLPKVPKPEVGISAVEKPTVEMTVPPTPSSVASATLPALDIELPSAGVELGLAQREREVSEQEPKVQVSLETLSRELEVEISLPKCALSRPELGPGMKSIEGPPLAVMVAQFPKVGLAFEEQPVDAEGPKADLEGVKMKLPTVEISSIRLPETTAESQAKGKLSRFALSKFSISGPKVRSKTGPEVVVSGVEGTEAANLGSKLKLPKFGISFPKSKCEAEAEDAKLGLKIEREMTKERLGKTTEGRMRLPSMEMDIDHPQGMEGWYDGDREGTSPELLGVTFKGPKISLLSLGGKGKEEEWGALESGEVKLQVSKEGSTGQPDPRMLEDAKPASKVRVASLGLVRREVEAKAKKVPESVKEKPQGPFGKMPQLKLPSLTAQGERKKFHLSAPELDGKVLPQVELPKLAPRAKAGLIPEAECPGFKVQVPSVEIAVPTSKAVEKPAGGAAKAEIQQQEGELLRPRMPSIQVSAPTLELGIGLSIAGNEEGILQAAPGTGAKIKLPKVELAKPEEGGTQVTVQLLGKHGEKDLEGVAEAFALGTKVRLPKVDISFPKVWLSEVELPPAKVNHGPEGMEAKFKMPSMGLPKLSTPKVKALELEIDVGLDGGGMTPKDTVGAPSVKWPKFGGSVEEGQGEGDLPCVPQVELRPPKIRGSTEAWGFETEAKEGRLKAPTLALGLGKLERETGMGTEGSKFGLKFPSLGVSKPAAELSLDTRALWPPAEEAEPAFRIPQIALPGVGFSGNQERGEEAKVAGATNLEGGLGMLKMPQIAITACGISGTKEGTETATSPSQRDVDGGEPEGKKLVFKVPGLEISAPSLKTHGEYDVEVPHVQQRGSLDLEGAGREGWKQTAGHTDAGKRLKARIPKFGLFLPRVGPEAPEGLEGQEMEAQRGPVEGSGGLLERREQSQAKAIKLKLRAPFGLSLPRPKGVTELNGAAEAASSKVKVSKLGFPKAEGATQLQGERAGGLLQGGVSKLGKIPLPQVELLSPSRGVESNPELSIKLVKADEAKEEAHSGVNISAALKAAKFKPPRIALPGFKKHNGESGPEALSAPRPQAETTAKGEPSSKFSFPKLALSSRTQEVLEISKHQQDEAGGNFRLLAFSAESVPGGEGRKLSEKEAL